ncbi:hypothetical protein [Bradyrhizobium tunisiense]|uniref:hypothetical protein n=1 Tax=Bradyrhizobium tunisiense TaxID=3278709 RepID=UPI0035DF079B
MTFSNVNYVETKIISALLCHKCWRRLTIVYKRVCRSILQSVALAMVGITSASAQRYVIEVVTAIRDLGPLSFVNFERWRLLLFLIVSSPIILPVAQPAMAQCASTPHPSCGVYQTCFEATCKCEKSQYPYFISYGKKYCERFLASTSWTAAGAKWRDKTLLCLQERIVPVLPDSPGWCDCKSLKATAFQIHVACYTQPGTSVCDLGKSDWWTILKIVDARDLFVDPDGRAQMLAVAKICAGNRPDGPVKDIVQKVIKALEG